MRAGRRLRAVVKRPVTNGTNNLMTFNEDEQLKITLTPSAALRAQCTATVENTCKEGLHSSKPKPPPRRPHENTFKFTRSSDTNFLDLPWDLDNSPKYRNTLPVTKMTPGSVSRGHQGVMTGLWWPVWTELSLPVLFSLSLSLHMNSSFTSSCCSASRLCTHCTSTPITHPLHIHLLTHTHTHFPPCLCVSCQALQGSVPVSTCRITVSVSFWCCLCPVSFAAFFCFWTFC